MKRILFRVLTIATFTLITLVLMVSAQERKLVGYSFAIYGRTDEIKIKTVGDSTFISFPAKYKRDLDSDSTIVFIWYFADEKQTETLE